LVAGTPDIAASLAAISREINASTDLEITLNAVVESAVRSLPGIDSVSITVARRDGTMETLASSDQLALDLDALQYAVGEGPCLYAIKSEPEVKVEHAAEDPRWPRYMRQAVERGLQAQLALQLYADSKTLGGLNMYSTTVESFDPDIEHLAEMFATHAALALGHARERKQLLDAIASRQVIGQAVGIVMERYTLTEHRAFDYLARVSSHSNVKLRDVAEEVVQQANRRVG
jgi:GAF domain-containing protein